MKKAPRVSRLSIHSRHLIETQKRIIQSVNPGENVIFSKLLGRENDYFEQHRNVLRSLHLDNVDLSVAAPCFPQYFNLCKLQELHISSCTGWLSLLKIFAAYFMKGNYSLRSFCLGLEVERDQEGVVENFLGSFKGLETFRYFDHWYDTSPESALDLQCLDGHLSSLKQLAIVPGGGDKDAEVEVDLENDYFDRISTRCTNLRQLGIVMPPNSTTGDHKHHVWYSRSLLKLLGLRNLRVLRIFNWPEISTLSTPTLSYHLLDRIRDDQLEEELRTDLDEQIEDLCCSMILQQMDIFVAGLLPQCFRETRKTHDSPMVCFNALRKNIVVDDNGMELHPDAACNVPVTQTDVFGQNGLIARRVSMMEAKYLEPENDILQWPYGQ